MMTLKIGSKDQGFTLIEVLLAVSILAIGLVGVLRAYATSANAMEKSEYDMDAVFFLKTAMAQIEEKALTEGNIPPGVSNGDFTSAGEKNFGKKRSTRWLWSQEVKKMDLPSKKVKHDPANKEVKPGEEKTSDFYLSKLKLTVADSARIPPRKVGLETYVRTESVKNA